MRNLDPESSDDEEIFELDSKFENNKIYKIWRNCKRYCSCNLENVIKSGYINCNCAKKNPSKTKKTEFFLGFCQCDKKSKDYKEATNTLQKAGLHAVYHYLFRLLKMKDFANLVWIIINLYDKLIPETTCTINVFFKNNFDFPDKLFSFPIQKILDFILSYGLVNSGQAVNFKIAPNALEVKEPLILGWRVQDFVPQTEE